jgi:hypothetical protein
MVQGLVKFAALGRSGHIHQIFTFSKPPAGQGALRKGLPPKGADRMSSKIDSLVTNQKVSDLMDWTCLDNPKTDSDRSVSSA